MGPELSWITGAGLDITSGIGYTGSEEKYISAIRRFYGNFEKNRDKITAYFEAADYENYMITVHALKSNARMIGAMELSSAFEELENASRSGDIAAINEKTGPTLAAYKTLIDALAPVENLGNTSAADEISGDEARQIADELLAALDDFDDELSAKLAHRLMGYPFRITQRDKLTEAAAQIEDFMYDEAADLIREIIPAIE